MSKTKSGSLRIFLINLDEDTGRLAAMHQRLSAFGLYYTRYSGHRGSELPGWLRHQFFDSDGVPHSSLNEGQIGCYASHLGVCRKIIEEGIEGPVLVLEDDLAFEPEMLDVISNLNRLPGDWEIVRCSTNPKFSFMAVGKITDRTEVVRYWRVPMCATAYFINRKGAERFVGGAAKRVRPVDSDLRRFWDFDLETYGLVPIPIRRLSEESSIQRIAAQSTMHRRPKVRERSGQAARIKARLRIFGPWISLRCSLIDLGAFVRKLFGQKRKYSPSLRVAPPRRLQVARGDRTGQATPRDS